MKPKRHRFYWALAGLVYAFFLQFFVTVVLNACEDHFKPAEICPPCKTIKENPWSPEEVPSFRRSFCFVSTNRTCPECEKEWTAPGHVIGHLTIWIEVGLMPWIITALRVLLPD
jgi:hypothetical protein